MANDPAFLFYPGDYLRDTQCLSEPAQVAYDRIMCEHMRNICISQDKLNFFTKRLTPDQKNELVMVLTPVEGGYQIPWVADSIKKRREYSEGRRNNRKGKTKSKEDINNTSSSYDQHMENENAIENEDEFKIEFKEGVQGEKTAHTVTVEVPRGTVSQSEMTDDWFSSIFDEKYMEGLIFPYRGIDVRAELEKFKVKVRGDPNEYGKRDTGGIRNAFLFQLNQVRPGGAPKTISADRMQQFKNMKA